MEHALMILDSQFEITFVLMLVIAMNAKTIRIVLIMANIAPITLVKAA